MSSADLAGLGGDPEEMERRIQAWAQGFADKADRYRAAHEETERIRLTAASGDGSVEVTVRADGTVAALRFTEKIRSLSLTDLSAKILATMHSAQSGIAGQVGDVMAERLGEEDPQTRELTLASLRARFPEQADEEPEPSARATTKPPSAGPRRPRPTRTATTTRTSFPGSADPSGAHP